MGIESKMNMTQTNLSLGSARVPRALANVPFASRTARKDSQIDWVAVAVVVRRETRRTAPETGALPET